MTFVFKELGQLKKEFDETVDIILIRDKKGKIEDLSNPRKYELQYLASILNKLEEQVTQSKIKAPIAAIVYYGAMLTIMKDIDNKRGILDSTGLLYDRLANTIGINSEVKAEDRPNPYHITKCYAAINQFLNQLFVDNDSRKGFRKDNLLHAVPTNHLDELIKTSYALEKDAEHDVIRSLDVEGVTKITLDRDLYHASGMQTQFVGAYISSKKTHVFATARFASFEELNGRLTELVKEELGRKNVSKIDKLATHRAAQLHFLNTLSAALQKTQIDDQEKVAILAGAMHLVRQQITNEYVSAVMTSTDNSIIHQGLDKILGKKDEVAPQDVEALIAASTLFLRFLTIEPKANEKKTIRKEHIFSTIYGFDVKATFNLFIDMIHACRSDALHHVIEEFKKESKAPQKPTKSSISFAFSSFFGKKDDSHEEDDEDDALEHNDSKPLASATK